MKILSAEQIRKIDQLTIERQGIESHDLMERAGLACADWFNKHISRDRTIHIICGMGNNGGDGLALTRLLLKRGYKVVPFVVAHRQTGSADFNFMLNKLLEMKVEIHDIVKASDYPEHSPEIVIVDAMLGTGMDKPLRGILGDVVNHIEEMSDCFISIDLPTGVFSDGNKNYPMDRCIAAKHTLTFEIPKWSMVFPQTLRKCGKIHFLKIGLDVDAIAEMTSLAEWSEAEKLEKLIPFRPIDSHKGKYGHALIAAGSKGMLGAAVLCTKSAAMSGCGWVSAHIPARGEAVVQNSVPEAMVFLDPNNDRLTNAVLPPKIDAVGVGPGIGMDLNTLTMILELFDHCKMRNIPVVLDADGLNLISKHDDLKFLPPNTILTPHIGELERLCGPVETDEERLQQAIQLAADYQCFVVLKGPHTAIVHPQGEIHFNTISDTSLATAGSGDVLTGLITGLLAQGLSPWDAARLGCYLHGKSGILAAQDFGMAAVHASVLPNYFYK